MMNNLEALQARRKLLVETHNRIMDSSWQWLIRKKKLKAISWELDLLERIISYENSRLETIHRMPDLLTMEQIQNDPDFRNDMRYQLAITLYTRSDNDNLEKQVGALERQLASLKQSISYCQENILLRSMYNRLMIHLVVINNLLEDRRGRHSLLTDAGREAWNNLKGYHGQKYRAFYWLASHMEEEALENQVKQQKKNLNSIDSGEILKYNRQLAIYCGLRDALEDRRQKAEMEEEKKHEIIFVHDICGAEAISIEDAETVGLKINECLKQEKGVTLTFAGVDMVAACFLRSLAEFLKANEEEADIGIIDLHEQDQIMLTRIIEEDLMDDRSEPEEITLNDLPWISLSERYPNYTFGQMHAGKSKCLIRLGDDFETVYYDSCMRLFYRELYSHEPFEPDEITGWIPISPEAEAEKKEEGCE